MLRCFFLAVLIACLTVPAAAMPLSTVAGDCHDKAEMSGMHHSAPQDEKSAPAKHECIGCVLPAAGSGQPGPASLTDRQLPCPGMSSQLDGAPLRPETPPPRG